MNKNRHVASFDGLSDVTFIFQWLYFLTIDLLLIISSSVVERNQHTKTTKIE